MRTRRARYPLERLYGFRVEYQLHIRHPDGGVFGMADIVRSDGRCTTCCHRGNCCTRAVVSTAARWDDIAQWEWLPGRTTWCWAHDPTFAASRAAC